MHPCPPDVTAIASKPSNTINADGKRFKVNGAHHLFHSGGLLFVTFSEKYQCQVQVFRCCKTTSLGPDTQLITQSKELRTCFSIKVNSYKQAHKKAYPSPDPGNLAIP